MLQKKKKREQLTTSLFLLLLCTSPYTARVISSLKMYRKAGWRVVQRHSLLTLPIRLTEPESVKKDSNIDDRI